MLNVLSRFLFAVVVVLVFAVQSTEAGGGGGRNRAPAIHDFGIIVDIQGNAQMKPANGEPFFLDRSRDLLRVTRRGDKLRVMEEGSIRIVSFSDQKLYEIPADVLVQVENTRLIPLRGMFTTISQAVLPANRNDLFTVWEPRRHSCIRLVSPIDSTAVSTLTPSLVWELNCNSVDNRVKVRILSGDSVVYELETGEVSLKVPKQILQGSNTYQWLVDAGKDGIVGATFSTLSETEIKQAIIQRNEYGRNADDPSARIAFILYLESQNLMEEARDEIIALKADFPGNRNIEVRAQEEPDLGTGEEPSADAAAEPVATQADAPSQEDQPADTPAAEADAEAPDAAPEEAPSP